MRYVRIHLERDVARRSPAAVDHDTTLEKTDRHACPHPGGHGVCPDASTLETACYGAPEELSTDGDTTSADCLTGAFKSLRGTVAGIATTEAAFIAVGPLARTGVVPREGLDFTIDGVAAGPQDLLAVRTAQAAPPRLILRRDLDLPNGSVVPTLDFASAEAFDMVTATLTIGNLGGDGNPVVDFSVLTTPHGEFFLPIAASGNGSPQPYLGLPANKLRAGDLERLHVSANGPTSRTADLYFRTPTDRTVTLGSRIEPPTIDVIAGASTPRLRAHYVAQADYDKVSAIVYNQPTSTGFVAILMTPTYAALAGGYDLDVPDLGSVPGFDPAWALQAGVINLDGDTHRRDLTARARCQADRWCDATHESGAGHHHAAVNDN